MQCLTESQVEHAGPKVHNQTTLMSCWYSFHARAPCWMKEFNTLNGKVTMDPFNTSSSCRVNKEWNYQIHIQCTIIIQQEKREKTEKVKSKKSNNPNNPIQTIQASSSRPISFAPTLTSLSCLPESPHTHALHLNRESSIGWSFSVPILFRFPSFLFQVFRLILLSEEYDAIRRCTNNEVRGRFLIIVLKTQPTLKNKTQINRGDDTNNTYGNRTSDEERQNHRITTTSSEE